MNETQKNVLRQHHPELIHDLELRPELLANFIQLGIFTEDMCEEIKSEHTSKARVQKLLSVLPKRGPRAFDKFIHAIDDLYPWLADNMRKTHHQMTTQYPDAESIALKEKVDIYVHEKFGGSKRFSEDDKKKIRKFLFRNIKLHRQSYDVPDGHNRRLSIDTTASEEEENAAKEKENAILKTVYTMLQKQKNQDIENLPDDISLEMIEDEVSELNEKVDDLQNQVKACYTVMGVETCDTPLREMLEKRFAEDEKRVAKLQEEIELVESKRQNLDMRFKLKEQQLNDTILRLADSRLDNEKMEAKLQELKDESARLEQSQKKHLQKQDTLLTLEKMVKDLSPLTRKSRDPPAMFDRGRTKLPPVGESLDQQAEMRVRKSGTRRSHYRSPLRQPSIRQPFPWKC